MMVMLNFEVFDKLTFDGGTGVEAEQWNRSTLETEWNWMTVTGLLSGMTYEVRVVAVTNSEHETRSETRGVMIGSIPGILQVYRCT